MSDPKRRPVHWNADPEITAALVAGNYVVKLDNYLFVADYELHKDDDEWWSDEPERSDRG